jgi:hypothetical protein
MWFYLNMAICVAGLAWSVVMTFRRRCLFSLQSAAWAATFAFFFVQPFFQISRYGSLPGDFGYNAILLAGLLGLFLASLLLPWEAAETAGFRGSYRVLGIPLVAGTVIYTVYCLVKVYLAYETAGTFRGMFHQAIVANYLDYTYLAGESFWDFTMALPRLLFFVGVVKLWWSGRRAWAGSLYSLAVFMTVASSYVRFPVTVLVLTAMTFVAREMFGLNWKAAWSASSRTSARSERGRSGVMVRPNLTPKRPPRFLKFSLLNLALTLSLLVGAAVLYNQVGQFIRGGFMGWATSIHQVMGLTEVQDQALRDLSYYGDMNDLYRAVKSGLGIEYGRGWWYYDVVSLVPRRLWPGKPITSQSVRMTQLLHGRWITQNVGVHTYTIYGEGYWEFSYFGAFLAPILLLLMYYGLIKLVGQIEGAILPALVIMFEMITYLRADLPVTVPIFEGSLLLVIIMLLSVPSPSPREARAPMARPSRLGRLPFGLAGAKK